MNWTALVDALRRDLVAAGFSAGAVSSLWSAEADAALSRGSRVAAVRSVLARRATWGPVDGLGAMFLTGLEVTAPEAALALPALGLDGAARLGLVEANGAVVRPLVELRPVQFLDADGVGEWWIAADRGEAARGGPLPEDHVLGVGGASRTLAGLQLPTPARTVLDLGTGCGIQALRAARYAERIVATDISARALQFARLNAALNEVSSIEFRQGSLYEPVAGERFDRILTNPPFVITPRADGVPRYEYRDGGLAGDALVEAVVRGAADHLTPGGVAQLLGNWEDRWGAPGLARAAGWAREAGLEHWLVEREVQDPILYAETWLRDGGIRADSAGYADLLGAWLDDFESRRVRSVGFGYVLLRRAGAGRSALARTERLSGPLGSTGGPVGAHLASCLEAVDWLSGRDDADLLAAHLVVAQDVTEERHYWPGDENPAAMRLRQGGGFAREHPLDAALGGLVGACDGQLSVGAIIEALATLLEADAEELRTELLPVVRELTATGFLLPAAD